MTLVEWIGSAAIAYGAYWLQDRRHRPRAMVKTRPIPLWGLPPGWGLPDPEIPAFLGIEVTNIGTVPLHINGFRFEAQFNILGSVEDLSQRCEVALQSGSACLLEFEELLAQNWADRVRRPEVRLVDGTVLRGSCHQTDDALFWYRPKMFSRIPRSRFY